MMSASKDEKVAAVWVWRYQKAYVELFDSVEEAAEEVVREMDSDDCAVSCVQLADGSVYGRDGGGGRPLTDWQPYVAARTARAAREAEERREWDARPKPTMTKVRHPTQDKLAWVPLDEVPSWMTAVSGDYGGTL